MKQDRVVVELDGETFTELRFGQEFKYPFFYPLAGPASGQSVTTWDTEPFPHHSSLFFACDHVNGSNYWQSLRNLQTGQIRTEWMEITENDPQRVELQSRHVWQHPEKEPDFLDLRRVVLTVPSPTLRQLDFTIVLEPLRDVRIRRNNHALFAARMAPDLTVDRGGVLINAAGGRGEDGTFGVPSEWMAAFGEREAGIEGLAIFTHPDNHGEDFTTPWFTRNYGFFSPTPMFWLEGGHIIYPKGEKITLRYRVVIFTGDYEDVDFARLYAEYIVSE